MSMDATGGRKRNKSLLDGRDQVHRTRITVGPQGTIRAEGRDVRLRASLSSIVGARVAVP